MKNRVLGKTHNTDKLKKKQKKKAARSSSEKKPMGVVEIEKSAYEKPKPLPFRTDDDYEEEYLRPESPEVVDLRDRYPPHDRGWIITDPPVCSDHKKKIQDEETISEPDSHDFDWVLYVKELDKAEERDMEGESQLSHAIEGKPEVKLTLEV